MIPLFGFWEPIFPRVSPVFCRWLLFLQLVAWPGIPGSPQQKKRLGDLSSIQAPLDSFARFLKGRTPVSNSPVPGIRTPEPSNGIGHQRAYEDSMAISPGVAFLVPLS